ncbi:MAG: SPOR domain-containing protein, partial [bacterium]
KALEEKIKATKEEKPKPKEEKPEPTPTPIQLSEGEYFTIQLQSSQDRERVEELLTELRGRGYAAYAIAADLKEKGMWYRIRLGKYNTHEEAVKDAENLRSKGIISNYWITKR